MRACRHRLLLAALLLCTSAAYAGPVKSPPGFTIQWSETLLLGRTDRYWVIAISPDHRRIAYCVPGRGSEQRSIYVGDQKLPDQEVRNFVFSPDSRHYAYLTSVPHPDGYKHVVVVDGKRSREYQQMEEMPSFSPDSRHVTWMIYEQRKISAVMDFSEIPDVNRPGVVFSPDARHYAYITFHSGEDRLAYDGVTLGRYHDVRTFAFSPDSRHIAFVAF